MLFWTVVSLFFQNIRKDIRFDISQDQILFSKSCTTTFNPISHEEEVTTETPMAILDLLKTFFHSQTRLQNQQRWPLHWMNFYTTVSDDDLFKRFLFDGEKKRRCYIASILRETRTRKVIESLDEFSFFYRRVEKYLLLNSFCTHNTGQRVSKDQFRNSDNIVECRKARLPRFVRRISIFYVYFLRIVWKLYRSRRNWLMCFLKLFL